MAEIISLDGKRVVQEEESLPSLADFMARLPEDPIIKSGHKALIIIEDKETEETTIYQFNCNNMEMLWLAKMLENSAVEDVYDDSDDD